MCGIAGFYYFDLNQKAKVEKLKEMTNAIIHRGPDDEGFFVEKNLALGHRRLSIIDPELGHQPMISHDNNLIIVFNGEIYNYFELQNELKILGHRFITNSDTEVILYAYQEWGTECVQHFNGVWAFALWDKSKQILFCSRDRLGEKPFFYLVYKNSFVFASEIKSLFKFGIPRDYSWDLLDIYLCLTYIPSPKTFFKNIYQLKPGYSLIIKNGTISEKKYWDIEYPDEGDMLTDEGKILTGFEELFYDAVRIRMRCDVNYGVFLSGGLDSGSVVAAMSKYAKEPVKTCTVGFTAREYDERILARMVAKKYHTDHMEKIVNLDNAESIMKKLAWHYDQPFGDSSALPTYIVTQIASEKVKMCLSGDGGDEVLSGYTIYQGEKFSAQMARLPRFVRFNIMEKGLAFLMKNSGGKIKKKLFHTESIFRTANMDFIDRLVAKQNGFQTMERNVLITNQNNQYPVRELIEGTINPVKDRSNFIKLDYWLVKIPLPDEMLCKVDRAAMANSLEVRTPFLDHRLIEFLSRVHIKTKLKGYKRKYILRKTVGPLLPPALLTTKKRGFVVPLDFWLRNDDVQFLVQMAFKSTNTGYISKPAIAKVICEHRNGNRNAGNALWSIAMLSCMLDQQSRK